MKPFTKIELMSLVNKTVFAIVNHDRRVAVFTRNANSGHSPNMAVVMGAMKSVNIFNRYREIPNQSLRVIFKKMVISNAYTKMRVMTSGDFTPPSNGEVIELMSICEDAQVADFKAQMKRTVPNTKDKPSIHKTEQDLDKLFGIDASSEMGNPVYNAFGEKALQGMDLSALEDRVAADHAKDAESYTRQPNGDWIGDKIGASNPCSEIMMGGISDVTINGILIKELPMQAFTPEKILEVNRPVLVGGIDILEASDFSLGIIIREAQEQIKLNEDLAKVSQNFKNKAVELNKIIKLCVDQLDKDCKPKRTRSSKTTEK